MKKHFCKNCQKEIEEGKGVKIERVRKWSSGYSSYRRYSRFPKELAKYYLRWECYDKEQQELTKSRKDKAFYWTLVGVVILLAIFLFCIIWYIQMHKWEKRQSAKLQKGN